MGLNGELTVYTVFASFSKLLEVTHGHWYIMLPNAAGLQFMSPVFADIHDFAESSDVPFGREKVITCYGIIGVVSLATSESTRTCANDNHLSHSRLRGPS